MLFALQGSESAGNLGSTVAGVVREVRRTYCVALNFIQSEGDEGIRVPAASRDVVASLDDLAERTALYQWRDIAGRYVLFPRDPMWDTVISGIAITAMPRLDATRRYVAAVRSQVPALHDLEEPFVRGEPNSPVYTEPVSLQSSASVIAHFVQLLGTNDRLAFTVERAAAGPRILHFELLAPAKGEPSP